LQQPATVSLIFHPATFHPWPARVSSRSASSKWTHLQNIKNGGEPYVPSLSMLYDMDNPGPEPTLRDLYDLNIVKAQVAAKM
jgi:hypothetical protein